jgi:hypothetical protein
MGSVQAEMTRGGARPPQILIPGGLPGDPEDPKHWLRQPASSSIAKKK